MLTVEQQKSAASDSETNYGTSLDMGALLLKAYELGDMVNVSAPVADYLYWKSAVAENEEAQALVVQFRKAKELFAECERFGRFHPDYHEARDKVKLIEAKLDELPDVARFKQAEQEVDDLLYEMAQVIAGAVSDTIKVPGNERASSGGGCGSGGSCSCGSGGCG
ncbi:YlbF family regulator [Paenibacillus daejeonensis]|uniref:YlbF family regulator n=1 Tax=Paenibacillus daejeonensis TaxID=135193 RepID=UPI000381ED03|nr:YlbF family regulator [Paenibacillus daejeonensis]